MAKDGRRNIVLGHTNRGLHACRVQALDQMYALAEMADTTTTTVTVAGSGVGCGLNVGQGVMIGLGEGSG